MFSHYDQNVINRILFLMLFSAAGASYGDIACADYSQNQFSKVINAQELQIDQYRMQEIKQLQLVLSRSAPQEQAADMVLRLAELYTEKYKLLFNKENEIWAELMDGYLRQSLATQKNTRKPILDNGSSKQWLNKAISTLERIPSLHGKYERLDEVYYFLGFNYWELGKKSQAIRNFENVVKAYPKSKFLAESHRYIADYNFANRDFSSAKKQYEAASRSENNPSNPRVLYGLAWSEFKLRNYKQAVNTMSKAIRMARTDKSAEKSGIALQRDAIDSFAMFYSEGGAAEEASKYFIDVLGKNDSVDALRKLAINYQHQGRYAQALAINKQLVELGGTSANAGIDQRYQIILDGLHLAESKGDYIKQVAMLKQLVAEFVVNTKSPSEDKREQLRNMVRKAALLAHQAGNKSSNPKPAFARAEELYRLYLGAFGDKIQAQDAAEIHYYLADSLVQQEKHQAAIGEFKQILSLANTSKETYGKYQKDSALGLILSLDSFFKQKNKATLSSHAADELINAIDEYVQLYSQDKENPKYLARAAGLLINSGRMEEARPRLLRLAEVYPKSKEAMDAVITLIKDSESRKDYQAAAELSEKILENTALLAQDKKGTLRVQLQTIASRAKFNQVQALENGQNYLLAAQKYEQLASESKDNEVRYKALNNAAVSYSRAADKTNQLRIYEKILQFYPSDEMAGKNILNMANENFIAGSYEAAAILLEHYYSIYEKQLQSAKQISQKLAIDSIQAAALLRSALEQQVKASEDFHKIVLAANSGIASARNSAEDFLYETATILKEAKNTTEAIRAYQKLMEIFPKGKYVLDSNLSMGVLYGKLQEDEKAQSYLSAVIAKLKEKRKTATPAELGFAAHARLLLLEALEKNFENSPLRLPEAQLKADINAKLAALDRLNKGYIEVIEFGDGEWGVEAFRRMALAYRSFARKLENAPVPTEFSVEDKAKFKSQLHNIAAPIYVKVNETLDSALKKGEALAVPGSAMAKVYLFAAINAARPDRYPLVQELVWADPHDWISGEIPANEAELKIFRDKLLQKQDEPRNSVAIGNWHLVHGQKELARIFYLRALDKNNKFLSALNNIAYLDGSTGKLADAMAGFKAALSVDEFAIQPKKNICRIYMASGLWRHANLGFRQLDVRVANDPEVKKGLALSYLALGQINLAELLSTLLKGTDVNTRFALAIYALAKGDQINAKSAIHELASESEYADLLDKNWSQLEANK